MLEQGNTHLARTFDHWLNNIERRTYPESSLRDLNFITKANIILSILGLGHIFRQQRHQELRDLPAMVNFLETELRKPPVSDVSHKPRGQRLNATLFLPTDTEYMSYTHRTEWTSQMRDRQLVMQKRTTIDLDEEPATTIAPEAIMPPNQYVQEANLWPNAQQLGNTTRLLVGDHRGGNLTDLPERTTEQILEERFGFTVVHTFLVETGSREARTERRTAPFIDLTEETTTLPANSESTSSSTGVRTNMTLPNT